MDTDIDTNTNTNTNTSKIKSTNTNTDKNELNYESFNTTSEANASESPAIPRRRRLEDLEDQSSSPEEDDWVREAVHNADVDAAAASDVINSISHSFSNVDLDLLSDGGDFNLDEEYTIVNDDMANLNIGDNFNMNIGDSLNMIVDNIDIVNGSITDTNNTNNTNNNTNSTNQSDTNIDQVMEEQEKEQGDGSDSDNRYRDSDELRYYP